MSAVASLFSGIGGFDLGFAQAGFESSIVAERDSNCLELLGDKFSEPIQIPDVLQIPAIAERLKRGLPVYERWSAIFERLRAATVFCGGFPCQDLSVAGQRAGLAGVRSGLWFVFRRIVGLFRPPWVVIENVPGLLSSNGGRDMFVILSGLAQLGYRWAYRVLDAQYFGLAQRRERVFIVASLGNYRCAEVLFERESLCWDSPPSRETGKRIAGTFTARSAAGGGLGSDFEIGGGLVENTESTKPMQPKSGQRNVYTDDISYCLNGGGMGRIDGESETFVTHALTTRHDSSEDGTGRGTPIVPIPFNVCPDHCGGDKSGQESAFVTLTDVSRTVGCNNDPTRKQGGTAIAFAQNLSATQCASTEEVRNPTAVAYGVMDGNGELEAVPTITQPSASGGGHPAAVAFTERSRADGRNFESQEEVSYALTNPGLGGRTHSRQIATQSAVRRLTPRECERLQGFPDDYTAGQSDSVRYRQLGNAVAVPVAAWIAKRLKAQL